MAPGLEQSLQCWFLPCSSPTWLLPFCCLSVALVALGSLEMEMEPWEMDFALARFAYLKGSFLAVFLPSFLVSTKMRVQEPPPSCGFSGGLCPSCLCLLPSPGLAGL